MPQNQLFNTENPVFYITIYNKKRPLLTLTEVAQNCEILSLVEPRLDRLMTERHVRTKLIHVLGRNRHLLPGSVARSDAPQSGVQRVEGSIPESRKHVFVEINQYIPTADSK